MHLLTQSRFVILLSAALALGLSVTASAQSQSTTPTSAKTDGPDPASQGWHVYVTPYLWFAGVNGTVGALDHETSVHVRALNRSQETRAEEGRGWTTR